MDAICNWMAERPWSVAVMLVACIVLVGAVEVPS